MRELKYRVYDNAEKCYSDKAFSIDQLGICYIQDEDGYWEEIDEERYIVEQYTGLKDKNGKDIYEGDIVRIGLYLFNKVVGVVEQHKDGGWLVIDRSGKADRPYLLYHHPEGVVIGNVHEDNDLLEDKK